MLPLPRAGLTADRVVAEAEQLADEVGLRQLTLTALAARLGVREPSLYKHIEGMGGLQRSIALRARLELADVVGRAAIGRSRADAVQAICHAYRAWALDHPGRYAATVRAPAADDPDDLEASAAVAEVAFGVLSGYGLSGADGVHATRAIRAALHGFLALEMGGGFRLPEDVSHSFDRLIDGLVAVLDAGIFDSSSSA